MIKLDSETGKLNSFNEQEVRSLAAKPLEFAVLLVYEGEAAMFPLDDARGRVAIDLQWGRRIGMTARSYGNVPRSRKTMSR